MHRSGTLKNGFAFRSFFSRGIRRGSLFFLSFGFALLFLMAPAASASPQNTLTVQTTGGSAGRGCVPKSKGTYDCGTLYDAISQANLDSGDTIQFAAGVTGTIDLTSTLPKITANMTINGPGANLLAISGQQEYGILDISADSVTISGLTFTEGAPFASDGDSDGDLEGSSASTGSAILDQGGSHTSTLTVANSAFVLNVSIIGGPITAVAEAQGVSLALNVVGCTFDSNVSYFGAGAIAAGVDLSQQTLGLGSVTVVNSTFHDNVSFYGGVILAVFQTGGPLSVVNSTFVGNLNFAEGYVSFGQASAITVGSTNAPTIENDIFADNNPAPVSGNLATPAIVFSASRITEGNNLFYNNTGGNISNVASTGAVTPFRLASTDKTTDPEQLSSLAYYGGPTGTMIPEPGSAAICNGNKGYLTSVLRSLPTPFTSPNDQRGFPIPPADACTGASAGNVDIGAVQTNYLLVTTPTGTSSGSLPYEVGKADAPGGHDVGFSLGAAPVAITLASTLNLSQGDTVIVGPPGGVTISGNDSVQILDVSGSSTSVTLRGLTFSDGYSSNGGAIDNSGGDLDVEGCTFTGNSALTGSGEGGAIYNGATLTVANSTFYGNSAADSGGAIYGDTTSALGLSVLNSTFVDNSASSGSGAIDDSASTGPETVEDDIFSANTEGSNGFAVDLANYNSGAVEIYNLYYGNYIAGTTTESDLSLSSYGAGDVTVKDPHLTPLANFGGPTQTMMPQVGSPAICAGSIYALFSASGTPPITLALTDQRGFPIGFSFESLSSLAGACANGNAVDIGAVQTNYVVVTGTGGATDTGADCSSATTGTTCSLPDAIAVADEQRYTDIGFSGLSTDSANPSTINLCPSQTSCSGLSLTQGNTVIVGPPDSVAIDGGSGVQILNVTGSSTFVGLYGLTLENGSAFEGGAIASAGTLTVANSTFNGNAAHDGGAIESAGTLTLTGSTFTGDTASEGGAVYNPVGPLTVINSTFAGNTAGQGGALYDAGTALAVANSTFYDNKAGSNGEGGAIYNGASGTAIVVDNIFANNTASSGGGIYSSVTIATGNEENNLFYSNSGGDAYGFTPNPNTDVIGLDPLLAPLGNYGGPTQTMLPQLGGAAICAGTPTLPIPLVLPTTDQRGFPRTTTYASKNHPTTCIDIGSVETEADAQVVTNYVNSLYLDGTLTSGQANSLDKELNKAFQMASEGKISGAINNLNDFIAEVNDLYDNGSGPLTYQEAQTLISEAEQAFPPQ